MSSYPSQDSSMNLITEYESNDGNMQIRTTPRDLNSKRENYLDWDDYFMALAFLSAKRSKDPITQVGACIVKEKKIVGLGYNGFPIGCHDDKFPWKKGAKDDLASKHMYVVHAEMNAIVNKISADVKDCIMYVSMYPCAECAKLIIQSGIKTIFYKSDKNTKKPEAEAAKLMFEAAEVNCKQLTPKSKIVIDFDEIDWNNKIQQPASTHNLWGVSRLVAKGFIYATGLFGVTSVFVILARLGVFSLRLDTHGIRIQIFP